MVPAKGQETARVVFDLMSQNPELHSQRDWVFNRDEDYDQESPHACQTQRCAAGWVLHVHDYSDWWIHWHGGSTMKADVPTKAAELLGLNSQDAEILFFHTDEAQALEAMEWLACGKQLQWADMFPTYYIEYLKSMSLL